MKPNIHTNRRHGMIVIWSFVFLLCSSVAVLWAWNTLAVDLFFLPQMQFKHGFALMLTVFVVLAAGSVTRRIFHQNQQD